MPRFILSAPNGKRYLVNAPEGMPQDAIIRRAQAELGFTAPEEEQAAPTPSAEEGIPSYDEMLAASQEPDRSLGTLLSRGLSRGATQMGSLLGDVLPAFAASAVGADEYAKRQMEEAAATQQQLQETNAPAYSSYKDIKGPGDILPFFVESLGEQGANLASMAIPGGAGAMLGRRLAVGAAERGLAGAAESAAGKQALEAAAAQGAERGALAGVGTAVVPTNIADTFQNIYEATGGEMNPTAAVVGGSIVSLLDMYSPASVIKAFKEVPGLKAEVAAKIAAGKGIQAGAIPFIKQVAGIGLKGAAREAGTEAAQEEVSILAEQIAGDMEIEIGPEEMDRILTAGAKALAPGAVFGGVEGVGVRGRELGETQRQQEEIAAREAEAQRVEQETAERTALETELPDLEQQIAALKDQADDAANPTRKSAQVQLESLLDDYGTKTERFRILGLTPEERAAEEAAAAAEEEVPGAAPTRPAPAEGTVEAVLSGLGIDRRKALTAIREMNRAPGVTRETAFSIPLEAPVRGDTAIQLDRFLDRYKATPEEAQAIDEFRQTYPEMQPEAIQAAREEARTAHIATAPDLKPKQVGNWYQKALGGVKPGENAEADQAKWTELTTARDAVRNKTARAALTQQLTQDFPALAQAEVETKAQEVAAQPPPGVAFTPEQTAAIVESAQKKQEAAVKKAEAEQVKARVAAAVEMGRASRTSPAFAAKVQQLTPEFLKAQGVYSRSKLGQILLGPEGKGIPLRSAEDLNSIESRVEQEVENPKHQAVAEKLIKGLREALGVPAKEAVPPIQESRAAEPVVEAATPESVTAALSQKMGRDVAPVVSITRTPEEAGLKGVSPRAKGAVVNGKAHLFTQNIEPGKEFGTFLHEVGDHLGMKRLVGEGNYNFLANKVQEWAAKGGDSLESKIARAAMARIPEGTKASDEAIAYFVEEAVDNFGVNPTQVKDTATPIGMFFRKLLAGIKNVLSKLGFSTKEITAQDMVDLVHGAAHIELRAAEKPPTYYSALGTEIESAPTKTASAQGWKDALKGMVNKGAVKRDEIEQSGIEDWLDTQPGKVSREQVADYLKQGGPKVEETVLGGKRGLPKILNDYYENSSATPPTTTEGWLEAAARQERIAQQFQAQGDNARANRLFTIAETMNEFAEQGETGALGTKYSQYTLPGGENYREVLLKLPEKAKRETWEWYDPVSGESEQGFATQQEAYDARPSIGAVVSKVEAKDSLQNYRSSHWDEPNVLAHIRMNDRTDADGNKVLFVEELQSDWAQEGRKKGFAGKPMGYSLSFSKTGNTWQIQWEDGRQDVIPGGTEEQARAEADRAAMTIAKGGARPPSAPFVTSTSDWVNLGLKRIIDEAVKGGYDKVAFINGEQSAERYDLSKQVGSVSYFPEDLGVGKGTLIAMPVGTTAYDPGARPVFEKDNVAPEDIENYIGKDLAKKLLTSKDETGVHFIEGVDLKVGGEGMKSFYDKIVPSAVNKLLPKVGGGKLETVNIKTQDEWPFSIELKSDGTNFWLYGKSPKVEGSQGVRLSENFDSYAKADAAREKLYKGFQPQPGFTVTPEMRAQVQGVGQPLFSLKPEAQEAAIQYSIAPDQPTVKKVYDQTFQRLGTTIRNTPVWKNDSARQVLGAMSNLPNNTKKFLYYSAPLFKLADMAETVSPAAAESIRNLEKILGKRKEKSTERVNGISKLLERNTARMKKFSPKQVEDFEELVHELSRLQIDPADEKNKPNPLYRKFHALPKELKDVFYDVTKEYEAMANEYVSLLDKLTDGALSPEMKVKYKLMVKRLRPYLPLFREGAYWMGYTDAAGEPVIQSFESELDRNLARQDAISAGIKADKIDFYKQLSDINPEKLRPTKEIASLIKVMEEKGVDPAVRDAAYQMFLQMFPAGSVMQQFKKRKGFKGYRPQILQNFAVVGSRMADGLTQFEYARNIDRVYADLNKELLTKSRTGSDVAVDLLNEMNARASYMRNPANNYFANLASAASYNQYLLGNISSSVMNTTSLVMSTMPMLGGEYGWNRTMGAMNSALSDYLKGGRDNNSTMKNVFTGGTLADKTFMGDKVREAANKAPKGSKLYNMKRLYDTALARQAIHQSVGIDLAGRKKTSAGDYVGAWANTKAHLSWLFQNSERMNREVTLLAAFNLEMENLKKDPKLTEDQRINLAIDKAIELVTRTQGPGSSEAGGRIFQSNIGKVIGTFKKYPLTQLYLVGDLFHDAFRGADKKTREIARKQLIGMYGMGMAFVGIKGLPLVGAGTFLASIALGTDDEPFDANQRGIETFGQLGWNGLVNSLTGLRVSDRAAIGQFFREDPKRLAELGPLWYAAEQIAGPVASIAKNYQDAYELLNDGQVEKALERAMPLAISNGIKAVNQAINGVRTKEGARIVDDPNAYNLFMQAIGFQSEAKARAQEINSVENQIQTAVLKRRTKLLSDLWRNRNDTDKLAATNAAIQKYNTSTYGRLYRITGESRIRSHAQYVAKVKAAEQHGGMAPNEKLAIAFRPFEEAAMGP